MEALIVLMILMICLGFTFLWILTIAEIVRSEFPDKNDRLIYLLLVILLPFIGTIIYLMIGRKQRLVGGSDIL